MQSQYQHFQVLSQQIVVFIQVIADHHHSILSRTVLKILLSVTGKSVRQSWINQLIQRCGIHRQKGRPGKEYLAKESTLILSVTRQTWSMDKMGIALMHDLSRHFGISELMTNLLRSRL